MYFEVEIEGQAILFSFSLAGFEEIYSKEKYVL